MRFCTVVFPKFYVVPLRFLKFYFLPWHFRNFLLYPLVFEILLHALDIFKFFTMPFLFRFYVWSTCFFPVSIFSSSITSVHYGGGGDRSLHPPQFLFFMWWFFSFCCLSPPRSSFPSLILSSLGLLSPSIWSPSPPANSVRWLFVSLGRPTLFVIQLFVYIGIITSTSMVPLYFYSHLQILVV